MSTLLGFGLIAAAVTVFAWAAAQTRRADAPRWTRSDFIANLVVLWLVGGLAFGAAFLVSGVAAAGAFGWAELAGMIVTLAAVLVFLRRGRSPAPKPRLTPVAGGAAGGRGGERPSPAAGGGRNQKRAA